MVYESATVFPTPEGAELTSPPPVSTYGFQKLAAEYFAKGAWEQYQLPYTIVRPFNCVGIGERRAVRDTDIMSGNVKLAMSPRRARPRPEGPQGPGSAAHPRRRPQVRHYTYGGDLPTGSASRWSPDGAQRRLQPVDAPSTTVLELAECIWSKSTSTAAVRVRLGHAVRARRPAPRSRRRARRRTFSATKRRPRSRRCSTRSSRGSATRSRRGDCDRNEGCHIGAGGGPRPIVASTDAESATASRDAARCSTACSSPWSSARHWRGPPPTSPSTTHRTS